VCAKQQNCADIPICAQGSMHGYSEYVRQRVGLLGYSECVCQGAELREYSDLCARKYVCMDIPYACANEQNCVDIPICAQGSMHGYFECVRQGVGLRGYSESLVYVTMYFAVSDDYHRTYKFIISNGLSNADVTTLMY